MLTRKAVIEDEYGKPLDTDNEIARLLAYTYSRIGADNLINNKLYAWIAAAVSVIAGIVMGVMFTPYLLLFLLVGIGAGLYAYFSKLNATVESLDKVNWVVEFKDIESGTIAIDKTDITGITDFSVSVLRDRPDKLYQIGENIKGLCSDLPLIKPVTETKIESEAIKMPVNELESDICKTIDELSDMFAGCYEERVGLSMLNSDHPSIQRIIQDIDSYPDEEVCNQLRQQGDTETEQVLTKLQEMTQLTQAETDGGETLDDFIVALVNKTSSEYLPALDEARRRTLVDIMSAQLYDISNYYAFTSHRLYCPSCFEKATQNAAGNAAFQFIDDTDDTKIKEKYQKRDGILKSSRLRFNFSQAEWYCPLCNARFNLSQTNELKLMNEVKDDIVYPLWDTLWMELSNETAQIVREKERERRESINQELIELSDQMKEFGEERRDMRRKLIELRESSTRATETLLSMISTFKEYEIISSDHASLYSRRVEEIRGNHRDSFESVSKWMETADSDLQERVDNVNGRRSPLIDAIDEVKVKGRFFDMPEEYRLADDSDVDLSRFQLSSLHSVMDKSVIIPAVQFDGGKEPSHQDADYGVLRDSIPEMNMISQDMTTEYSDDNDIFDEGENRSDEEDIEFSTPKQIVCGIQYLNNVSEKSDISVKEDENEDSSEEEFGEEEEEEEVEDYADEVPLCPVCGKPVSEDADFCPGCGSSLLVYLCENCGAEIKPEWTVCPNCGASLVEDE